MSVADALRSATEELARNGVATAAIDAEWLVGKAVGLSRSRLAVERDRVLGEEERRLVGELVGRRAAREPLAYVLGEWGFRRLTLKLDARALVPRPETEVTVERCLALLDGVAEPTVLDVGTGSGAIALALADEHPGVRVTAIDSSEDALALARENVEAHGFGERIELVHADAASGLPGGPYDLVVSNPPYVLEEELPGLAPEVVSWEPRGALVDRGQTELVARQARAVLVAGGRLVLETHWAGAPAVAALLAGLGYTDVETTRDLAGRERVVEGTRP